MKRKFMYLMATAVLAVGIVGCEKDDDQGGVDPKFDGKETVAQFIINTSTVKATRGADDTAVPTDAESKIDKTSFKIFVFESNEKFEKWFNKDSLQMNDVSTGVYSTGPIRMNSGKNKRIYAFFDPNDAIPHPTKMVSETNTDLSLLTVPLFEKAVIGAGFAVPASGTKVTTSTIPGKLAEVISATDGKFLIGSLWSQTCDVEGGYTDPTTAPKIEIAIGRAVAKVNLASVVKGASNLKGDFAITDAIYRLRSMPINMSLIGQWNNINGTGKLPGVVNNHGQEVISWAHSLETSKALTVYVDYPWTDSYKVDVPYYTTENTHSGVAKHEYSTHIQMKIKYSPKTGDDGEVFTDNGAKFTGTLTNGTFWVYEVNGDKVIFDKEDPQNVPGLNTTVPGIEYVNGINYYTIYVADKNENELNHSYYYRILRNHYYEVNVTGITRLGEATEDEPGPGPDGITYVNVEIKTQPWSKVSNNVIL